MIKLIIYLIDFLLSRILFSKFNQILTKIGVIPTLKLANQNNIKEEKMKKKEEIIIEIYETNIKNIIIRVKL